ncbi:pilin N-terminal domain-containing protein [uncultured Catenibacterium sp.]|uniref:pilin N-terminal domain-containing protein n=1 Tax=uncultured Catenibacterium sp. TaxID=286142 RepID=UPI0026397F0F|nr:pilin N-terminal domain-containing protein [uncultured Catenibacterium sp.]
MKVRNIIMIMIVFFMSTFMNVSTIHADSGSRKGSIQIVYKGRNELNKEVNLSGAKFSIYQVQYMSNDTLTWKDNFKDSHISLVDTSAQAREKQAKQLYEYTQKKGIPCLTQETNTLGRMSFRNLDQGIYLIVQKGYVESGKSQFESALFLVSIPSLVDGSVEYSVKVEPKAEWIKPEQPKPSKLNKLHIKTGDDTNISVWVIAVIESLCIMVLLYKNKADSL